MPENVCPPSVDVTAYWLVVRRVGSPLVLYMTTAASPVVWSTVNAGKKLLLVSVSWSSVTRTAEHGVGSAPGEAPCATKMSKVWSVLLAVHFVVPLGRRSPNAT